MYFNALFPQKRLDETVPVEQRFTDADGEPLIRSATK
jgi:hypothetical protein